MKAFRIFSFVMVLAIAVSASLPVAALPAAAQPDVSVAVAPALMGLPIPFASLALPSASADYACNLVSQSPKDWVKMQRRQYFDMVWTVQNTGKKAWTTHDVDFTYWSGSKFHTKKSVIDLPKNTGSFNKIKLIIDAEAPREKGYYTTVWALKVGGKSFCKVTLSINVYK